MGLRACRAGELLGHASRFPRFVRLFFHFILCQQGKLGPGDASCEAASRVSRGERGGVLLGGGWPRAEWPSSGGEQQPAVPWAPPCSLVAAVMPAPWSRGCWVVRVQAPVTQHSPVSLPAPGRFLLPSPP